MTLANEIKDAESNLAALKRQYQKSSCIERGSCNMQHLGGKNAGCGDDCSCSVPVHVCSVCGDSDYGDNSEAKQTIEDCEAATAHIKAITDGS